MKKLINFICITYIICCLLAIISGATHHFITLILGVAIMIANYMNPVKTTS